MGIQEGIAIKSNVEDTFDRSTLINGLTTIIIDKARQPHPCYTIGIYGKWGEGKTSVLNMLQEQILEKDKEQNIHICRFNPWMITGQTALIQEFFDCICSNPNSTISNFIKKYGGVISYVASGVGTAMSMVGIPVLPGMLTSAAKKVDELRQRLPERKSLTKQKEEINELLKNENAHLVVMIDDLDRLDKEELHAVFRLIRQVADFDNVTYVLAMDETIVAQSIGDYFGEKRTEDGRKFLEKIVQVPIVLPALKPQILINYAKEQLNGIMGDDICINQDEYDRLVTILNELFGTKREYIRYFNQLQLTWSFVKGEVNFRDLCYLEAIKCCCVSAYNLILQSKSSLCAESELDLNSQFEPNNNETDKEILEQICSLVIDRQRATVHKMINVLFPHGQAFMRTTYAAEKRACSPVYFDKYFVLSTLDGYICDKDLDKARDSFIKSSKEDIVDWLNGCYERYSVDEVRRCVETIILRSGNADEQQTMAMKLFPAIAQSKEASQYGYTLIHGSDSLAIKMVVAWMPRYIKPIYSKDDFLSSFPMHKLWLEISRDAPVAFCMAMICYFGNLRGVYPMNQHVFKDVFATIGRRLDKVGCLEYLKYSPLIQYEFFSNWARIDEPAMLSYVKKKLSKKQLDIKEWTEQWHKDSREMDFINLFQTCLPEFVKRIRQDYPEEQYWSEVMRDVVVNGENDSFVNQKSVNDK